MSISTLKIGLLTPAEMQQLAALTREVSNLSGERFSLLDPQLVDKLRQRFEAADAVAELVILQELARRLAPTKNNHHHFDIHDGITPNLGVKVRFYDRPAA